MSKMIGAFLRVLADYADEMDCDRPEDIIAQIIANKVDVPVDSLNGLSSDMESMQRVLGNISRRVRTLEKEAEKSHKCNIVSLNPRKYETKK